MSNGKNITSQPPSRRLQLKIADIVVEARCADPDTLLKANPVIERFVTKGEKPDCVINVHFGSLPDIALGQQIFDSGGPWRLYSDGQKLIFQLLASRQGQIFVPILAVFEPSFENGELYILPQSEYPISGPVTREQEKVSLDPFQAPLDEVLLVNLLALRRGLHIHALGIVSEGRALVFCGVSGAGKSTLAELWKKKQVRILSDDRISIRKKDGKVWAYGTPWHGDARISLPEKAPLDAIYFIVHGKENRILPLTAGDVAIRLMVRCFPTYYLKPVMESTMKFVEELSQEVSCYELQFTPDERAVDEVLSHVENRKA